jgi:hypothetical protein
MKRIFALVIAAFFFAVINPAKAEIITKKFDASKIEALEVRNTSGDIQIKGSDDKEAVVNADKVKMDEGCKLTIELNDKTLAIELLNTSWLKRGECQVNFDIKIPKKSSIDLKSGSGSSDVRDTDGKIKFASGSGSIKIKSQIPELEGRVGSGGIKVSGNVGNFEIRSGSGTIDLEGLTDAGDIQNGSGKISLKYSKLKTGAELKIRSGSGDSTVYLPPDSKISTDFSAGSGRITNEFGDSQSPTFKIAFKAGSGDLKIKKIKQ